MANKVPVDEVFKVPSGAFCLFRSDASVEYDELDRPVISINAAGGAGEVKSVQGKIGRVRLTTDDIPDGTDTKQLTNELRDKILNNETHIQILDVEVGDNKRDIIINRNAINRVELALQSKQDLVVGAASTAVENNFTPNKIVVTNNSGKFAVSNKDEKALLPNGGTANQILVKNSNNDYDVKWSDPAAAQGDVTSVNTKKGDVVLTQDDVSNGVEFVQTHNDYTNTDKQQVTTNKNDIATIKQQLTTINTRINQKVSKSGDTMTGSLTLFGAPTTDNMAATKKYVDDHTGDKLPTHTVADENKVLSVDNGNDIVWRNIKEVPASAVADANKVLTVGVNGEPQWLNVPASQNGLPVGGTIGQTLVKNSNNNFDVIWQSVTTLPAVTLRDVGKVPIAQNNGTVAWGDVQSLPVGGAANQVLKKASATDYDVEWSDIPDAPNGIPNGGKSGYVLTKKNDNDYETYWQSINKLPDPKLNVTGQILTATNDGTPYWSETMASFLATDNVPGLNYILGTKRDPNNVSKYVPVWVETAPGKSDKPWSIQAIVADETSNGRLKNDIANPSNIIDSMPVESAAMFCDTRLKVNDEKTGQCALFIKGQDNNSSLSFYYSQDLVKFVNVENMQKKRTLGSFGYDIKLNFVNRFKGESGQYYGRLYAYNGCMMWNSENIYSTAPTADIRYDEWLPVVRLDSTYLFSDEASDYYPRETVFGHFTYGDLKIDRNGQISVRYKSAFDPDNKLALYNHHDGCGSLVWFLQYTSMIV